MRIADRLQEIKKNLQAEVKLVAVSKTQGLDAIMETYNAGQRDFGENKVQELLPKAEALPKDIRWHMIGHLQSNKVKFIAPFIHLIHSVDSESLLHEINKQGIKHQRIIPYLLQVHIAREESKYGFDIEEARRFLRGGRNGHFTHARLEGLMGMATLADDPYQVRDEFLSLETLFAEMITENIPGMNILSMGMSGDYKMALECGSTMVRIGSALFGSG